MNKSILGFFLIPCVFLLCSMDAMSQQNKLKTTPVKTIIFYTVKNVIGSVTLNQKPLKVSCANNDANCINKVREIDIPNIRMAANSFLELQSPSGKQTLYGAANCAQPPCQPLAKVVTVNKGPKKEFLLGTEAEWNQIMTTFNQNVLNKQDVQLNNQQLQLEKVNAPLQQKAPQKLNNKAKAGGGR